MCLHSRPAALASLFLCAAIGFGQGIRPTAQSIQSLPVNGMSETGVARQTRAALDRPIELGKFSAIAKELESALSIACRGIPLFVDSRGLQLAGIKSHDVIARSIEQMPLRSALRKLLSPHGLRAIVQADGLVITADHAELARRGIGVTRWLNIDQTKTTALITQLDREASFAFDDVPLEEAINVIQSDHQVTILIDKVALEEIGLTVDVPVEISLSGVSLKSFLKLMLHDLDLTLLIRGDVLMVTTPEAAEQSLLNRIYWIAGTGLPQQDANSIMEIIGSSIHPETWDLLGGPSTITSARVSNPQRVGLVISTTLETHLEIEAFFETLRAMTTGSDPEILPDEGEMSPPAKVGGMF